MIGIFEQSMPFIILQFKFFNDLVIYGAVVDSSDGDNIIFLT